jgi:hypothetical protein
MKKRKIIIKDDHALVPLSSGAVALIDLDWVEEIQSQSGL